MNNVVKIVNQKQAEKYIINGLNPLRVYFDGNKIVYEFDRLKSKPYFDKWCKYELN